LGVNLVTIPTNALVTNPNYLSILNQDMYFRLQWSDEQSSGFSQSGLFTILNDQGNREGVGSKLEERLKTSETDNIGLDSPALVGSTLVATTATALPTATSTGGLGTNMPSSISDGSNGGLAIGAIVGIAVGCGVVAFVAIGLLVWLFCFRRRKNSDHVNDMPYNSDGHTGVNDYMVEKETSGRVAESPHSPYSDDGQLRDGSLLVGTAPSLPHDTAYTPYTDVPATTAPVNQTTSHEQRHGARSATPQGVSSSVAHLVEEGMTAEQIRRLEEEERALDAAIEQAGRR
jgi:hypothetical protein